MEKIEGIKSVDFKITAEGFGVVNWNGKTTLRSEGRTVEVNNHTMPKLRGYSNLSGRVKEDTGYKFKKEATVLDFKETPLYISQNCIRHHLFKAQAYDLHFAKDSNLTQILSSITGLIRGYVVPNSQSKRTSPLLLEDFVDELGNGNFEQMGRSGSKEKEKNKKGEDSSTSFFSKTTFGETKYTAYGSISIEQLQFISLDNKFDRAAIYKVKEGEGEEIAQKVQDFIKSLDPSLNPEAVFHPNYVRSGTIFEEGEQGIMLNQDAIRILVNEALEMISNLSIRQAKGYMYVSEVEVDFNNSKKMMRIKRGDDTEPKQTEDFAVYFHAKDK